MFLVSSTGGDRELNKTSDCCMIHGFPLQSKQWYFTRMNAASFEKQFTSLHLYLSVTGWMGKPQLQRRWSVTAAGIWFWLQLNDWNDFYSHVVRQQRSDLTVKEDVDLVLGRKSASEVLKKASEVFCVTLTVVLSKKWPTFTLNFIREQTSNNHILLLMSDVCRLRDDTEVKQTSSTSQLKQNK